MAEKNKTISKSIKAKKPFCHFSVDDVWRIFQKKGRAFDFLKELFAEFGVVTSLYIFSRPQGSNVLNKVKADSWSNYPWLRFGPHAPNYQKPFNTLTLKEQLAEVNNVSKEIKRIAGKNFWAKSVRLHYFEGSRDICLYLAKTGVEVFLTTDFHRGRISYCLPPDSRQNLDQTGKYLDRPSKLYFVKSSFRVEEMGDIENETRQYLKNHGFCVFYTHEEFLTDPIIQKRIRKVLTVCQKKEIPFVI